MLLIRARHHPRTSVAQAVRRPIRPLARWVGVALLFVLLTGCNVAGEELVDGPSRDVDGAGDSSRPTERVQRAAQILGEALVLLEQYYVDGAPAERLAASAQTGAWDALAGAGSPPGDLERPGDDSEVAESLETFLGYSAGAMLRYGSKADPVWLAQEMIREAADSLDDCHTAYLNRRQVQEQVQRMSGTTRFGGIGVILRRVKEPEGFLVVEVFEDGPAARAGLRPGDRLITVNGEPVAGFGIEWVVSLVRGPQGSPVRLGIVQPGGETAREVEVVRAAVSAPILRSEVLDGNFGYLRFYSFPEPLTAELDGALREFERHGVGGVIVDLRDNSGGSLDVVTKVTSRFVREGPIFQRVGRGGERTIEVADGSYWKASKPLVVLVNSGTGSGGEIFAAAVKEHGMARLVGSTTSGCVSTGQMFPLADGSAIEIATNRVVSGLRGSELNRVGVAADVTVVVSPSELASERDRQLARAVEILRGG